MGLALYRKYRPQRFADVIGQTRATTTLQQALKRGQIAHAYLFAGPRGTGKTTVARLLARAVNCAHVTDGKLTSGEPCNACPACKRAQSGRELDLIEIDAASNRGIDEIRELRERVRFAPAGSAKKVFLIDEVHMLTKEAFNALLKTLEEPPAHVIFILATTELHSIPATIMSRVQQFTFRALAASDLVSLLTDVAIQEKIELEKPAAELIASLAEGGARDALSLLDVLAASANGSPVTLELVRTVLALPPQERYEAWLAAVLAQDRKATLGVLQESYQTGYDLVQLAKGLVRYMRLVLLASVELKLVTQAAPYLTPEQRAQVDTFCQAIPQGVVLRAVTLLNRAVGELRTSGVPLLPLEVASLEIIAQFGGSGTASSAIKPVRTQSPAKVSAVVTTAKVREPRATATKVEAELEPVDETLLQTLLTGWSAALASVRSKNVGIGSLLKSATLLRVTKTKAWFVVEYPFHRDRIQTRQNRHLIEETLEQQFGRKLNLECVLTRELSPADKKILEERKTKQTPQAEPLADLALNLLGGQVVE